MRVPRLYSLKMHYTQYSHSTTITRTTTTKRFSHGTEVYENIIVHVNIQNLKTNNIIS